MSVSLLYTGPRRNCWRFNTFFLNIMIVLRWGHVTRCVSIVCHVFSSGVKWQLSDQSVKPCCQRLRGSAFGCTRETAHLMRSRLLVVLG
jgi:hypothetical protein